MTKKHVTFVDTPGWLSGSRYGYYEHHIGDDQWWTHGELTMMLAEIGEVAHEAGHFLAWQTVRTEWNAETEHWYLQVDVYGKEEKKKEGDVDAERNGVD